MYPMYPVYPEAMNVMKTQNGIKNRRLPVGILVSSHLDLGIWELTFLGG